MCLEPVIWTSDGWWRPANGKQPSLTNDGPDLPGFLRLNTQDGDVNSAAAYQSIPLQRIDLKRFDAVTEISFDVKRGATADNYADFDSFTVTNQD
jgi:hypothetical protein